MDFMFNCSCCHGPIIARTNVPALHLRCPHCSRSVEVRNGRPVTEKVVDSLLELPLPGPADRRFVLRRVRPATRHSSFGSSRSRPAFSPNARAGDPR